MNHLATAPYEIRHNWCYFLKNENVEMVVLANQTFNLLKHEAQMI